MIQIIILAAMMVFLMYLARQLWLGIKEIARLEGELATAKTTIEKKEKQISNLHKIMDDLERQTKLSMFRVGAMMNVLDYIRKIKNTEDPKYYLEVSANMAEDVIKKLQMNVKEVGNRMAHF